MERVVESKEPVYLTVRDMTEDLTNVTGNREYSRAASTAYAIHYKETFIDTIRFQRGIIDR